jgi:hypothetical protein
MGVSIHIAVVDTGGTSDVKNFRIVPPPDTHLRWTDQDLVCLAVNMARCAVGGVITRLLGSTWRWRTENGGLTIETAGLGAYTTGTLKFDNEVGWTTIHIDKALLEKYEAWLCEPL